MCRSLIGSRKHMEGRWREIRKGCSKSIQQHFYVPGLPFQGDAAIWGQVQPDGLQPHGPMAKGRKGFLGGKLHGPGVWVGLACISCTHQGPGRLRGKSFPISFPPSHFIVKLQVKVFIEQALSVLTKDRSKRFLTDGTGSR